MSGTWNCPAHGCQEEIPLTKFMCYRHWRRLHGDLQRDIKAAYNRYLLGEIGIEELRKLQQPAIDYIASLERPFPPLPPDVHPFG